MKKILSLVLFILIFNIFSYADETENIANGDFVVVIQLKSANDYGTLNMTLGTETKEPFQFKDKFVYIVPKSELLKEVNELKENYKKRTPSDKEYLKTMLIVSTLSKTAMMFKAKSNSKDPYISGKMYFDCKLIEEFTSDIAHGIILSTNSTQLTEMIVSYLDK
ncbi:hypothetical protein MASR1M68_00090 [Elusimicrobiota bacterium]